MTNEEFLYARVTYQFTASAERVFDAWLDPSKARLWFGPGLGEMTRVEIDPRIGGKFNLTQRRDGEDVEHIGEYLEMVRPTRLVFTWIVPKYSSDSSRVIIDIEPLDSGCLVNLAHELPAQYEEYLDGSITAWTIMMKVMEKII
jgi:uncharacterized protein YndB with AHSA1/START domain